MADALTEVLRSGARELLQQAVEAEVAEFIARHRELKDERERQRSGAQRLQAGADHSNRASVTWR